MESKRRTVRRELGSRQAKSRHLAEKVEESGALKNEREQCSMRAWLNHFAGTKKVHGERPARTAPGGNSPDEKNHKKARDSKNKQKEKEEEGG